MLRHEHRAQTVFDEGSGRVGGTAEIDAGKSSFAHAAHVCTHPYTTLTLEVLNSS